MERTSIENLNTNAQKQAPRVFIAEDSLLIGLDLENILTEIGCDVVGTCGAITKSLEVIQSVEFDAAILDYALEDGTSEPLIEALTNKGTPFALCTAWNIELLKRQPSVPVIGKPYSVARLKEIIALLVGGPVLLQST